MKAKKPIRLPKANAGYEALADFFESHDGVDLLKQGIMVIDKDRSDLDELLARYRLRGTLLATSLPPDERH